MSWLLFGQLVYLLGVVLWVVVVLTTATLLSTRGAAWKVNYAGTLTRAFVWPFMVLWWLVSTLVGWW